MINIPERRVFESPLQLRDTQLIGRPYKFLEGRAVPYNEWADIGPFLEQHAPGSLDHTTRAGSGQNLPLMLFHNNQRWPIGHVDSWRSDEGGLNGVWRLNELPEAQQAASLANAGDLTGMSIGFQPVRSDWEYLSDEDWNPDVGRKDRVTRMESRLLEVSLTPTPAFSGAEVALVRTAERPRARGNTRLDGWVRELAKLKR